MHDLKYYFPRYYKVTELDIILALSGLPTLGTKKKAIIL